MARIGVVGAGVMGTGVTQNFGEHGHSVILIDRSKAALESADENIGRYARFGQLLGGAAAHRSDIPDRVHYTTDLAAVAEADFVVENVTESWNIKQEVYSTIERFCLDTTPLAANTSAIPITRIAGLTEHQGRVLGIHFMNPVPMKDTVEVIRGWHTTEATIDAAADILRSIGKCYILVNDAPGFVSNRVLMLTINEAIYLVQEGTSSAADVDRVFQECFGHRMGPLATADLIGLDTILYSIEMLHESFHDSKYRPCPLLAQMVYAGILGKKSGTGFYNYE